VQFGADDERRISDLRAPGAQKYGEKALFNAKGDLLPESKRTPQGFRAALTTKDGNQIEELRREAPIIVASLLSYYLFPIALERFCIIFRRCSTVTFFQRSDPARR
jgi:hypothetical protein